MDICCYHKTYQGLCKKKRESENDHIRKIYILRNRITRDIKKSKIEYHRKNFVSLNSNIKNWDVIRKIVNIIILISQLEINGKITDDPVEITNKIYSYFVNLGPQTKKGIPKVPSMTSDRFPKIAIK